MNATKPEHVASSSIDLGKLSPAAYAFFQRFIQAESGIVIDEAKQYMLESRLVPILASTVAKSLGISTLEQLSQLLMSRSPADLTRLVLEAMTTHETFFFRDVPMFEALRRTQLPAMLKRVKGSRKLRIWSAAASTGQEAYSLAMLLTELHAGSDAVDILGTDISTTVLDRAREARYTRAEVNRGLSPTQLERYFSKNGTTWQLCDEIRSMVHFQPIDLRHGLRRLGMFDLILCRNVLIYFDTDTKRKILDTMLPMLFPSGALVLGCAETIININDELRREQIGAATFYVPKTNGGLTQRDATAPPGTGTGTGLGGGAYLRKT